MWLFLGYTKQDEQNPFSNMPAAREMCLTEAIPRQSDVEEESSIAGI